jgi:nucleotide-binding universal stress UspA family protein
MTPRILIPVDESETAQHTINAVINNKDLLSQEIMLLHVVDVHLAHRLVPDIQKNMVFEAAEKSGNRILEELAKPFQNAGIEAKLLLELGNPGETISRVVKEMDIQLVIIGRHPGSGGLRDMMFGSVANYVIRAAKCPVILV